MKNNAVSIETYEQLSSFAYQKSSICQTLMQAFSWKFQELTFARTHSKKIATAKKSRSMASNTN